MSIKPVVKMGNLQLATPSMPVSDELITTLAKGSLDELIRDMRDTMQNEDGIGIAAPQIGCNLRVIMFGFEKNQRYADESGIPFTVLINPTIKILSNDVDDAWEGCLSVPGLRGVVQRPRLIEYSGVDLTGHSITRVVEGFHARVVQHEYDHLDGILYPQRIRDMRLFGFEDELMNRPM